MERQAYSKSGSNSSRSSRTNPGSRSGHSSNSSTTSTTSSAENTTVSTGVSNDASFSSNHGQQESNDGISNKFRELDFQSMKGGNSNLGFMLVGHGVPYQLLQDHVDCAWNMLNEIPSLSKKKDGTVGNSNVDDGEVVECVFHNDSKRLDFDGVQARTRDNVIFHHPQTTAFSNSSLLARFNADQELYLTVMNRFSTTFGTILQTQPPPTPSSNINTDKYWKRDILNPMSCWRATFRRGFVYPPSATSTSFDSFLNAHDGKVKEGREFWTGPPIVELFPAYNFNVGQMGNSCSTNFVRVTLQGIPSVFWQEQECDSGSLFRVRKDEFNMIPLSLVFEACFSSETGRVF